MHRAIRLSIFSVYKIEWLFRRYTTVLKQAARLRRRGTDVIVFSSTARGHFLLTVPRHQFIYRTFYPCTSSEAGADWISQISHDSLSFPLSFPSNRPGSLSKEGSPSHPLRAPNQPQPHFQHSILPMLPTNTTPESATQVHALRVPQSQPHHPQ
jgi:hypothetical protein